MSKARMWRVVYMGRWDTGLSYSRCMSYRECQKEAARLKREGARKADIIESEHVRKHVNDWMWADAFYGGQPPLV